MKPQIIKIKNSGCGGCGNHLREMPYWGSKEGIAAGENKRVRVLAPTIGIKKAA